jgi:hypothetical protein
MHAPSLCRRHQQGRLVPHGLEVVFREGIVVGGVRAAVRLGDAEIGEQEHLAERIRAFYGGWEDAASARS